MKPRMPFGFTVSVIAAVLTGLAAVLTGIATGEENAETTKRPLVRLTQIATIDTLLSGRYDGWLSLGELKRHGNFGLGTVDRIDGELTVLDGVAYRTKWDGSNGIVPDEMTTPFASVTTFDRATAMVLTVEKPLDFEETTRYVDRAVPDANTPLAIMMEGRFSAIEARSETGQNKPYRPLAETMKTAQHEFRLGTKTGTVVGFRAPPWLKGLNVPGCHFHFIASDRRSGGHLLHFRFESGRILIQPIQEFLVILPKVPNALADVDLSKDRTDELRRVEQVR